MKEVLSVRSLAQACKLGFPLSIKSGVIGHPGNPGASLLPSLMFLRAQCLPWEVLAQDSKDMAVHAALLPTGDILYFGGYQVDDTHVFSTDTADITDIVQADSPSTNMFCGGHACLADGRFLVAGGQLPSPGMADDHHEHGGMGGGGERACWIYDHRIPGWKRTGDLNPAPNGPPTSGGRWYPTLVTLADARVLAVGGHPDVREVYPDKDHQRHNNNIPERYTPDDGTWTLLLGDTTAPNEIRDEYQRVHLLPDGNAFFSTIVKGQNRVYEPYDGHFLASPLIGPQPDSTYHQGSRGSSVMLPLLPKERYRVRVMVLGGQVPFCIDLGADSPMWTPTASRDWPGTPPVRVHALATLLPTGEVFVSGGTSTDGSDTQRQQGAVREGELYQPGINWTTGRYDGSNEHWRTVAQAAVPRHYHGTALLMPDGVVWTAGSNGDGSGPNETRIELYRPGYTGQLDRPEITRAPAELVYGQSFEIRTTQAEKIRRVVLLRNGSVTHAFNTDQRYVVLEFSATGTDRLVATAPPWPGVAPPGYYMLWVLTDTALPCKRAHILRLASTSTRTTAQASGVKGGLSLKSLLTTFGKGTPSLRRSLFLMQRTSAAP